ncbi:MAG: PAS domain S-box protein [Candidatus Acidiferrales bacterium]
MRELAQSQTVLVGRHFAEVEEAEAALRELADVQLGNETIASRVLGELAAGTSGAIPGFKSLNVEAKYRALVEQIPAVVFLAYLEKGIGEAYVSPQIEAALGYTQSEWLEDPVRWYRQIHPEDKQRWSTEAAEMFVTGRTLRSAYRVIARDGRVLWFQCEARMIRRDDGEPWFMHGVGFDITELKQTEEALQEERNVLSAILDTVGALIVVLDPQGRIVRFNRACEQTTGFSFTDVRGKFLPDLFVNPEESEGFRGMMVELKSGQKPAEFESTWLTWNGTTRRIAWSTTVLEGKRREVHHIIATGIDITERKHLEKAILEISGREQRRIGQDLHDGLGQHLTGIAFMSKVLEQKLSEKTLPEAADAKKIVTLVNEAINKTRELSRGLLPVMADEQGLMSALKQMSTEVEDLFQTSCRFECEEPVLVRDLTTATHLYHIVQEAVNNAIKHGQAKHITIVLAARDDEASLEVRDDGPGIPEPLLAHSGMGLRIMSYRANMIGGSCEVRRNAEGGTTVMCAFPVRNGL